MLFNLIGVKIDVMRKLIAFTLAVGFCFADTFFEVKHIKDKDQIRTAKKVDEKLRSFISEVKECMKTTGRSSRQCICYYRGEFEALKSAYKEAIDKYPDWKGVSVTWKEGEREYLISFPALRRQIHINEMSCGWW